MTLNINIVVDKTSSKIYSFFPDADDALLLPRLRRPSFPSPSLVLIRLMLEEMPMTVYIKNLDNYHVKIKDHQQKASHLKTLILKQAALQNQGFNSE